MDHIHFLTSLYETDLLIVIVCKNRISTGRWLIIDIKYCRDEWSGTYVRYSAKCCSFIQLICLPFIYTYN